MSNGALTAPFDRGRAEPPAIAGQERGEAFLNRRNQTLAGRDVSCARDELIHSNTGLSSSP
jgi:hypothetical protein